MRIRHFLFLAVLAGCAEFPDLDRAISPSARAASYPQIAPLDGTLLPEPEETDADLVALASRAAALRARAERLRGTPIE